MDQLQSFVFTNRPSDFISPFYVVSLFVVGILILFHVRGRNRNSLVNIRGPVPQNYEKGNSAQLMNREGWAFMRSLEQYGGVSKLHGPLGTNSLYVFDPKALYHIFVKDQHIFGEPMSSLRRNMIVFGPGLLSTSGEVHRKQRKLLNPVFSTAHLREMLPIFYEVAGRLRTAIAEQLEQGDSEVDILRWMSRASLELIGRGGLGYSFDPLTHDVPNPLADALKALPATMWSIPYFRQLVPLFPRFLPEDVVRMALKVVPSEGVQRLSSIIDILQTDSKAIWHAKKADLERRDEVLLEQVGRGKDLMSVLLKANTTASAEDRLPDREIIAQMAVLTFAATDTTSSALARIFQLLAEHPDVQEKLRTEINDASKDGEMSYDRLVDLPYMDAVIRETLRLYTPVSLTARQTRQETILPLSQPIRGVDGALLSEIVVPKGTSVQIGILACNTNKAVWGEDALDWKPERWLSPVSESVTSAHIPGIYANLMTFLGGGRACIGFKFSQLEMKVVLAALLANFVFEKSDKVIVWNLAGVSYPTIRNDNKQSQLPIRMKILK